MDETITDVEGAFVLPDLLQPVFHSRLPEYQVIEVRGIRIQSEVEPGAWGEELTRQLPDR